MRKASHAGPVSRSIVAHWAAVALLAGSLRQVWAQQAAPAGALKTAVVLLGANGANDALTVPVKPGLLSLDLLLQVEKPLTNAPDAKLTASVLLALSPPGEAVETTLCLPGGNTAVSNDTPVRVRLAAPDVLRVRMDGGTLRPSTTYKGWLILAAGGQCHRWELTVTTGGRGTLAVEPVGTLKFATFPWTAAGAFSITIRDKTEGGPYHHVRARFEPAGTAASKALTSNFSLDTFSFTEATPGGARRVDLEQRMGNVADAREGGAAAGSLTLGNRSQRTLTAQLGALSPGEYTGGLRFVADESADDAQESKLALTIQVRHHWLLPVLVIVLSSIVGWFSSKYVGGARKARELGRQVKELRAKADSLARPGLSRSGWEFPGEATSYGLAQVRVMLSQLARHAASPLHMLLREEEAKQQRLDAEQRLAALEALRAVRLRVEPFAAGRPAAQLALGRLLRRAHDLIERPTFGQTQQADLTNLLQTAEAWLSDSTRDAKYREALVERRRSDEIPNLGLDPARKAVPAVVHDQLVELLGQCPTAEVIADQQATPPAKLQGCDQTLAKLALLWRERATDWAAQLATMCGKGQPIEALFSLVDDETWKRLAAATDGELRLERHPPLPERLDTYQLVEVRLRSSIPHLSEARIFRHPLRVGWRITPPGGHLRSMETNGLTLVQYFPLPGTVAIEASLRWQGREIPLGTEPLRFTVDPNPEYGRLRVLRSELTEWAAIAIAAGFAVATAMSTLYDPTFGSFGQYLALFLWAAGAGTGGNIFKELGATATPGGRSDATLPAAAPGGTAAAGR